MDLIKTSIERPIAVVAAVLMIVMFGLVGLYSIPIQLAPDVRQPVLNVETIWPGGAPAEVEREITNEQEEVLKGLEGLEKLVGEAQNGRSRIRLEFGVGQNLDRALVLTSNRLDRVSDYPEEAVEPTIDTSGTEDNPIAWFVIRRDEGVDRPIHTFGDFAEDVVRDRMERVRGVSRVNIFGGSGREMRVIVDPKKMARYLLTVPEVLEALRASNAAISAGRVEEGKRRYTVRTEGDLDTVEKVRAVVLRSQRDEATGRMARVVVGDIADVRFEHKEPTANIRFMAEPAIAFNAVREDGANVIETMKGVREAVDELNRFHLPREGLNLVQVYDETVYIDSAIDLVRQNIWVGGVLAAAILTLFLRAARATVVVSVAIPVSVVGSFVAMAALGRSLNVISLAGLAFAVGMVVDAAIVVLENIYRLRQQGRSPFEAAYEGARQVWGAVFVSALTTVMVFIPILIMELEVGQLFRDIAVAISVSVTLSLIVSATLIPALAARLLRNPPPTSATMARIPIVDGFARGFHGAVLRLTRWTVRSRMRGVAVVMLVSGVSVLATWALLPKLEYLPSGNRNLIIGWILPPAGYNLDTVTRIGEDVEGAVRRHWSSETGPEPEEGGPPKIQRFFFVALRSVTIVGASSEQPERAAELIPVLSRPVFSEPGTFGIMRQPSLFGRGVSGSRSIGLDITGPDLQGNVDVARRAFGLIAGVLPRQEGNQFRPRPSLSLGQPEVRLEPDRTRLADNGVSVRDLGLTIDAFNDGIRVDEITVDGKLIDLMLIGPDRNVRETQGIASLPVVTSEGRILPVSSLAGVEVTNGPTEIRHIDRARAVTIEITPRDDLPLQAAIELIDEEVIQKLEEQGLPPGVRVRMSGSADKLAETWDHMVLDLLLALVIVYLVMAVLFESFVYPAIIMLTVPLATVGGVIGFGLLGAATGQKFDMLTLLGFVILIGIVVNNAILLVHQTLHHIRGEGMAAMDAILESTSNRVRPIFMSTLTSVFGMAPLVLFPGAGSELYRGLGSVVLGGLALSAVLTLAIIPPLMSLLLRVTGEARTPGAVRTAERPAGGHSQ